MQIRQKLTSISVIGMGNVVSTYRFFSSDLTNSRHFKLFFSCWLSGQL